MNTRDNQPNREDVKQNSDNTDEREQQDQFPGYPHYPSTEDITMPSNNNGAISIDGRDKPMDNETENEDIIMGTEADVTKEDLQILDSVEEGRNFNDAKDILDSTDADGDELNEDNSINDLDIPGSELDDRNEAIGEEDEANNYYSLGDNKDDAE